MFEGILIVIGAMFLCAVIFSPMVLWGLHKKKKAKKSEVMVEKVKPQSTWNISSEVLDRQSSQYFKLKIHESFRGISTIILSLGLLGSVILQVLQNVSIGYTAGVAIVASVLIYFIYSGHRWAMTVFIISFTLNLLISSFDRVAEGTFSISSIFLVGSVWVIVVSYLVKAIRVENYRRNGSHAKSVAVENQPSQSSVIVPIQSENTQLTPNRNKTKLVISTIVVVALLIAGLFLYKQSIDLSEQQEWNCLKQIDYRPSSGGGAGEGYYKIGGDIFKTQEEAVAFCVKKLKYGE